MQRCPTQSRNTHRATSLVVEHNVLALVLPPDILQSRNILGDW